MLKIGTKVKIVCTKEKLIGHSNAKINNGKEDILINNDLLIFKVKIDGDNINIWVDCIQEADTYILPEKWCIDGNLDRKLIGRWFDENRKVKVGVLFADGKGAKYLHWPVLVNNNHSNEYPKLGYKEITFDQFKKYVLKQDINKLEDKSLKLEEIKFKLIKAKYDKEDIKDIIECLSL